MIDMDTEKTRCQAIQAAERIYQAWDEALGRKDLDAAMRLYAPDAILESPLVRHLLGGEEGSRPRSGQSARVRGKGLCTDAPSEAAASGRRFHRWQEIDLGISSRDRGWSANGPGRGDGHCRFGLIQRHCVYWGWLAVKVLEDDQYRSD